MKRRHLLAGFLFLIAACAEVPSQITSPVSVDDARQSAPLPASPSSADSGWDGVYSRANSHSIGDTVMIRLSANFRSRLAERWEKANAAKALVGNREPSSKITDGKFPVQTRENEPIEFTIREVLGHGVFLVSAAQTLHFGQQDSVIWLEGCLRERDIGKDDTVSADALFNLRTRFYPEKTK
jgi:flagellar basal body L-ring protein FlgH